MVTTDNLNITAYSDALVVLITAGVLIPVFRRWGVNPVLGYLAAGALLGPLGLGSFLNQFHVLYWLTIVDSGSVAGIAQLGIVFLLFVIGLELSLPRLARMRYLVGGLGGLQVLLSTFIITSVILVMGQSLPTAIILGAGLSLSSTAIVLEILSKQNRTSTNLGRATFAVLLAQDIAAMPILIFVSVWGSSSNGSVLEGLFKAVLQAAIAIGIIIVSGRFMMRPLFRLVAASRSSDLFIAAVLLVILGAGVIAHQAGLSMALGAFVAGLLLAETEFRKAIKARIEPFKGLLMGVFFFTVGMRIDVRELLREPGLLIACIAGLIAIKTVVLTALARLFRLSWMSSFEAGLLLGPSGEFAFVVIGMAADLKLVSERISSLSLAVTSITMATIPMLSFFARRLDLHLAKDKPTNPDLLSKPISQKGHAIVVGYGRVGKVVCTLLEQVGVPYIATDSDPMVVLSRKGEEHSVYFGDTADMDFLRACGVEDALGVIITINAREAIDEIVVNVRSIRLDIPIISRALDVSHARHLYKIGASEAVTETIEASLQLSEVALLGIGTPPETAIAFVQKMRSEFRSELNGSKHTATDGHEYR